MDEVSQNPGWNCDPEELEGLNHPGEGVWDSHKEVWNNIEESEDGKKMPAKFVPKESWPEGNVEEVGHCPVKTVSVQEGLNDVWGPVIERPKHPEDFDVVSVLFDALNVCEHYIFFTYLIIKYKT